MGVAADNVHPDHPVVTTITSYRSTCKEDTSCLQCSLNNSFHLQAQDNNEDDNQSKTPIPDDIVHLMCYL